MVHRTDSVERAAYAVTLVLTLASAGCATSGTCFPWPSRGPMATATRADVTTVNPSYRRTTSQILVRKVSRPSRANLDYAAYHGNFMNADPAPEGAEAIDAGNPPDTTNPFAGVLMTHSLTGSIASTQLSAEERAHPVVLPPLVELLASKKIAGADRLEDVVARIRSENWGLGGGPQFVRQTATLAFLHRRGGLIELWLKVEFAPWFTAFTSPPDEDGDGFPEIYGRVDANAIGPLDAIETFIRTEYEGRVLSRAEVKGWAHQLASYWYPSYNTDLVDVPGTWPDNKTEADIRQELGGRNFVAPTVVMRGKPLGKPVYNVFLVEAFAAQTETLDEKTVVPALKLTPSKPTPNPAHVGKAIRAELGAHGGTWAAWMTEVAALHRTLKRRLAAMPAESKAIAGSDGFLFFRNSLAYVLGGDLAEQRGDRNPIPVIVEFQKMLAERGVDFLFVPVPAKVEIFPDKTGAAPGDKSLARFAGKVVNPFERKFLLDLGDKGVETLDLLPMLLAERKNQASEPLYQAQDTHWTTRGLELVAKAVGERIKDYPWFNDLVAHRRTYTTKDESFTRHGDLHSRLPHPEQAQFSPETLVGHQVVASDGELYDDDPDSPVVLLGDSFTGVYQLMDCEHAGVSAHLAKEIGYPIDLVMSYGGGPNVREKLLRRGIEKLATKKLVIWMMTARDLFDHAEGWQPLNAQN
jgi:hypothetical protein